MEQCQGINKDRSRCRVKTGLDIYGFCWRHRDQRCPLKSLPSLEAYQQIYSQYVEKLSSEILTYLQSLELEETTIATLYSKLIENVKKISDDPLGLSILNDIQETLKPKLRSEYRAESDVSSFITEVLGDLPSTPSLFLEDYTNLLAMRLQANTSRQKVMTYRSIEALKPFLSQIIESIDPASLNDDLNKQIEEIETHLKQSSDIANLAILETLLLSERSLTIAKLPDYDLRTFANYT